MSPNHDVAQIQIAGWVIGRLKKEGHLEEWVYQIQSGDIMIDDDPKDWIESIRYGFEAVRNFVCRVRLYVIPGIMVGVDILMVVYIFNFIM